MRLSVLAATLVLAALLATVAHATVRPVRPSDAPLLNRPATYEEQIAEQVAARLTHLHPKVRCGPLGIPTGYGILGITLFEGPRAAGYFLMLPQICEELASFRASPASYDPRTCADEDCMSKSSG